MRRSGNSGNKLWMDINPFRGGRIATSPDARNSTYCQLSWPAACKDGNCTWRCGCGCIRLQLRRLVARKGSNLKYTEHLSESLYTKSSARHSASSWRFWQREQREATSSWFRKAQAAFQQDSGRLCLHCSFYLCRPGNCRQQVLSALILSAFPANNTMIQILASCN